MKISSTELVAFANELADASGAVIRPHFRSGLMIEDKVDETPVTIADRSAERALRDMIEARFPEHGIAGEEFGVERGDAEYVWSLDPIDGTKSFVTGNPLFGTLIALTRAGYPFLGVIDMPVLGERWVGLEGEGTTFGGAPAQVRACAEIGSAWLLATSPTMFKGVDQDAFDRIASAVKFPLYGGDCYNYGRLASGMVDLVVEAELQDYDFLATVPVIEAAGGIATDWDGERLHRGSSGKVVCAGDARVHAAALKLLQGA